MDAAALLRGLLDSYPDFQAPQAQIRVLNLLPTVLANKAGLTQCFSNLLCNAVKFVPRGQLPRVLIWAEDAPGEVLGPERPSASPAQQAASSPLSAWHISKQTAAAAAGSTDWPRSGTVRIWFEDNGIGIDHEHREKIWVMFQRLDKSYPGTGIGLALVRKAVERMGGRVGLESEPGRGSRFWIELQRADASP